jgi:hypothetical protein
MVALPPGVEIEGRLGIGFENVIVVPPLMMDAIVKLPSYPVGLGGFVQAGGF